MRHDEDPPSRGSRRWPAVLLVALVTLWPSHAAAHDALLGTEPEDGETVEEAPEQVVLTFAAEQAGVGAEVAVTGPDGSAWSDGAAVVAGATVTQPLLDGMPAGDYTVAWRSVAGDGHPVSGTFRFALAIGEAGTEPEASAAPQDAGVTGGTAGTGTTDDVRDADVTDADATDADTSPGTSMLWLLVGLGAVVAAVLVGLTARRRGTR